MTENHYRSRFFQARTSALLALLLLSGTSLPAQSPTGRYVRIIVETSCRLELLRNLPSCDDHAVQATPEGWDILIAAADTALLAERGCRFRVIVPDVTAWYAERAAVDRARIEEKGLPAVASTAPTAFRLGSVAGSYTFAEFDAIVDSMIALYPELIDQDTIGLSVEGRPIRMFTITAPSPRSDRPRALFTGLTHAREPISMVNLVYTMWFLLERHRVDRSVSDLLENRVLHFVPIVNPDGYAKNLREAPNGGGMWRPNMRDGVGVDLNRNYGPLSNWSSPPEGASNTPGSGNYRGPSPFSEPEIAAIRDLYDSLPIAASLHHHSYGNVLLYEHADHRDRGTSGEWPVRSATALTSRSGHAYATGGLGVGYLASGTVTGFGRDAPELAGHVWTPESGKTEDGFWPLPSRYPALCARALEVNLAAARAAGPRIVIESLDVLADRSVALTIRNVGTDDLRSEGTVLFGDRRMRFGPLSVDQAVALVVPPEATDGHVDAARSRLEFVIDADNFVDTVAVTTLGWDRQVLFEERFDSGLDAWSPGLWGIETVGGVGRVVTDSPYETTLFSSQPNTCRLRRVIDLAGFEAAEVRFRGWGRLQGIDFGFRLLARSVPDGAWQRLSSDLMQEEMGVGDSARTVVRGDHGLWREYRCRLDPLLGDRIELMLEVYTDARHEISVSEGMRIDELTLWAARNASGVNDEAHESGRRSEAVGRIVWRRGGSSGSSLPARIDRVSPENPCRVLDMTGRDQGPVGSLAEMISLLNRLPSGVYTLTIPIEGAYPILVLVQ